MDFLGAINDGHALGRPQRTSVPLSISAGKYSVSIIKIPYGYRSQSM